jgi:hypothetical protein
MRLSSIGPWLLVAAAAFVLLGEALLGGLALVPYDALASFEPWRSETGLSPTNTLLLDQPLVTLPWIAFFAERLQAGELPLWNPHAYLGQPIHAALTGGLLWPLNAPLMFGPAWELTAWIAFAKLVLAGGFCAQFARRVGLGAWPAAAAGVGYGLCGFQVVWLGHPHTNVALLLPLGLLSVERLAASATRGGAWRRDVLLVALWSGGMGVAGHVQTALHAGLAIAAFALARGWCGPRPRFGVRAWCALALGGFLGAALAAPQLVPFVEYLRLSRAPQVLATVDVTSPVAPLDVAVMLVDPWHHGSPVDGTYTGPLGDHLNFVEIAGGYVGRVLLGLAALGVASGIARRSRAVVATFVGTALAAALAWQVQPVTDLAGALPVLGETKTMRCALLLALGLALLGAYGLARLLERVPERARTGLGFSTVIAIAAEVVIFGRGFNPTLPPEQVFAPTPTLAFLAERDGRALGLDAATLPGNANVPYGISSPSGYDSIEVDRAADVVALLSSDSRGADFVKEIGAFDRAIPLSRALAIRDVLARVPLPAPFRPVFEGPGGLVVHEDPGALPRAFVARGHVVVADEAERLARLGASDFDPLVAVVEEPPPFAVEQHPTPPGSVRFLVDDPRRIVLAAELDAPALVVLADTHYPGWYARVDGEPAAIVRVDHALRGVWLRDGAHEIEMVFAPRSFTLGLLAHGAALALLGALFLTRRRAGTTP